MSTTHVNNYACAGTAENVDASAAVESERDSSKSHGWKTQIFELIVNNLEVGVYVAEYYTGDVIFVNQKTLDLLQSKKNVDELIGQKCWKALGGYDERCAFCPHNRLIDENGEPCGSYTWEYYFSNYGFWGKVTNQAARWINGSLMQVTLFYDISDTKEMQKIISEHIRSEEQYRMQQNMQTIFDLLPLPIRIADIETGRITYVNKMFLEKFEYNKENEVVGQHLEILVSQKLRNDDTYRSRMQEILTSGANHNSEVEYISSTGKTFYALLSNCVIDYNGRLSSVGIITDLSAEKEQRNLLMKIAEREHEANRLKSSFISNMSHEIRTPMNAIIGLTEIELRKNQSEETLGTYSKIKKSAQSLLQIINDILDISKIEANKVELIPIEFELEDVLSSALLVVSPKLTAKPVELILNLSHDMPRLMIGDKTRLWQILRNLLDNSAKFTVHGSILLTVSECKETSTEDTINVLFSVTDTGVGMNEEQAQKIFLPYEQIHEDIKMRHAGSGLGLSISKKLCELMGGEIRVDSKLGHGTTMRFTIPFTRVQSKVIEGNGVSTKQLSGLKVLLVDDSELSLRTMEELLQSNGVECTTADSGEAAFNAIHRYSGEQAFDIIVLDYVMNGMSGLECARLMRQELPNTTKILVLTGYETILSNDEIIAYGVDDQIEKPFAPTYFLRKLSDVLESKQRLSEEQNQALASFRDTRVLVCEDNEINQEIISAMLEQFGITVVMAENGQDGIELLENEERFDMVLMDLHMPVMDGYKATEHIRGLSKYDDMPIISLTADAMVETLNDCIAIGINDVITKPTSFDDLQKVLTKWLPKQKQVRINNL